MTRFVPLSSTRRVLASGAPPSAPGFVSLPNDWWLKPLLLPTFVWVVGVPVYVFDLMEISFD
jgi:hypothetical protein